MSRRCRSVVRSHVKYILFSFMLICLGACASNMTTENRYKSNCYDRGYDCEKISDAEKKELLSGFDYQLESYVNYFRGRKGENWNQGVNRFVYLNVVVLCRRIALVELNYPGCVNLHQQFDASVKITN